jgi:hypothetical protein
MKFVCCFSLQILCEKKLCVVIMKKSYLIAESNCTKVASANAMFSPRCSVYIYKKALNEQILILPTITN